MEKSGDKADHPERKNDPMDGKDGKKWRRSLRMEKSGDGAYHPGGKNIR
jgi:hypothetical protein